MMRSSPAYSRKKKKWGRAELIVKIHGVVVSNRQAIWKSMAVCLPCHSHHLCGDQEGDAVPSMHAGLLLLLEEKR